MLSTRSFLYVMTTAMVLAGVIALARDVRADDCRVGCAVQRRACLRAAVAKFLAAKTSCREEYQGCRETCDPGLPPVILQCLMGCGKDLRDCAMGVASTAKQCVRGCRALPAGERLPCLLACAEEAEQGAVACYNAFEACGADCVGGGSPSGAFIDDMSGGLLD